MSNNVVSQQLSMHGVQMGQLEHISNKLDSSMQMGFRQDINDPAVHQLPMSNNQMGSGSAVTFSQHMSMTSSQTQHLESIPNSDVLHTLPMSNMGRMDQHAYNMAPAQFSLPKRDFGEMEAMLNNVGTQQFFSQNKRKTPMEPMPVNSLSPRLLSSNKRAAHMEHRPWLQQTSATEKIPVQMQPVTNSPGSQRPQAQSKKPNISKSGPQQLPVQRKQTIQMQPSPRVQNGSFDSVRSKLRQSLADALALVTQQEDKPSKSSQGETTSSPGTMQDNPKALGFTSVSTDSSGHDPDKPMESLTTKDDSFAPNSCDGQKSQETAPSGNGGVTEQSLKVEGRECEPGILFRDEDVSFSDNLFVKDELLQGNGLSWVLEANADPEERKDIEGSQKQVDQGSVTGGQTAQDPKVLASKIEAELFKLFGGVNKKYKEKGRSLLFNLKDRNNPELRERVMSGEIPPERLCSMTAEELASKELSEWRQAKAEELAQMVVLPDDVDVRRLVKKTHKGEIQVEVEQQDSVSVEVAVGSSSVSRSPPKSKEREASPPLKPSQTETKLSKPNHLKDKLNSRGNKSSSEAQDVPCTLTIPSSEGSDLMQGLIVDDEFKDADFLPPIVSLDEFMESLDSEPPFEDLSVNAAKTAPTIDKDDSPVGSDSKSSDENASGPADTTPDKSEKAGVTNTKLDSDTKALDSKVEPEITANVVPEGEHVWEGSLQLNISTTASVLGIFKSGERTSTKEWSGSVDIKGRVRLDAFEKFLQELPMSRSRAVMAVHFVCKEGSTETERASLSEVAESYVSDGRVGFAEPAPGVELYLCPPHSKSRDMLVKVLPKDQTDALNAIDNGLIGVIVWRKAHVTSTISPNSSSHHKHNSKKQHFSSRKLHEKDTPPTPTKPAANASVGVTTKHPLPRSSSGPQPDDDDDDVPPGFGPPASRDEDDLPEFNFSSGGAIAPRVRLPSQTPSINQHPQTPHPEQMRELVQRYGQSQVGAPPVRWPEKRGFGVAVQPWDDDDDDMPEWRPDDNTPQQHLQPQSAQVHGLHQQQPLLRPHMVQQPMSHPGIMQQPQANVIHGQQNLAPSWQQGTWVVTPGSHGHPVYQINGGQVYGGPAGQQVAWSRDPPRSRGF